jgi:pimeloyl-ACP methyl ester carboxylesterase
MWVPFLERTGGRAPDLPRVGRAGKRGDRDYSIGGYDRFVERFLDEVGVDRVSLVMHDWGAAALAWAQRFPARVHRLVVMSAVPLLPGYRWHRLARVWRTPMAGEMFMGLTTKFGFRLLSREGNVTPGPLPPATIDSIWRHFDQGTQRAILKLYRSSPPDVLAAAGTRLRDIEAPALVVWGEQDPYLPPHFADLYAERLPGARLRRVDGAGHWPWLDRPELIDEICAFLVE